MAKFEEERIHASGGGHKGRGHPCGEWHNQGQGNYKWDKLEEANTSLGGKVIFLKTPFCDAVIDEATSTKEMLYHELSTYSKICCHCVGTTSNVNLSGTQKELLLWHWKLGISRHQFQELMQPIKAHESSVICHEMPPVIIPILKPPQKLKTPHFVSPVNWLVLNAMCLKLIDQ